MSALLPARSADAVFAFTKARAPAAAPAHPLEAVCATLRAELDEARTSIADSERHHDRAVEAAREEGRLQGLAEAERREAERMIALEGGLESALHAFEQKLIGLDHLAAELAGVALERLFDDPVAMRSRSASFIARQVQALRHARLIRARVSAQDFENEASLTALGQRLREAGAEVEVLCDAALHSGQARFDLTLGSAELDLASQWQSLAAALRAMAQA
jgi:flagellar biosynthesis/type III secretory pathway protein FliH